VRLGREREIEKPLVGRIGATNRRDCIHFNQSCLPLPPVEQGCARRSTCGELRSSDDVDQLRIGCG
jgi:hypothetical protein